MMIDQTSGQHSASSKQLSRALSWKHSRRIDTAASLEVIWTIRE